MIYVKRYSLIASILTLFMFHVIFGCTFDRSCTLDDNQFPDSVEVRHLDEVASVVFFNIWLGSGPENSLVIESCGYFYLIEPSDSIARQICWELPVPLHDFSGPSFDMVYSDRFETIFALAGNGLFEIPWGDSEANSVLVLDDHYNNECHYNTLMMSNDCTIIACVDKSIFTIDVENMSIIDSLSFNSTIFSVAKINNTSSVYILHSTKDSISVVQTSASDSLYIDRVLYTSAELDEIGVIDGMLYGHRRGYLFEVDENTGNCMQVWTPPEGSGLGQYGWILSYPWDTYAFRTDHIRDVLELVDTRNFSVINSFNLNLFRDPLIEFFTPSEGYIFDALSGTLYRFITSE